MLKTILSVSGKPGLYRLLSQGKNTLIVESLQTKQRIPILPKDRVVWLKDNETLRTLFAEILPSYDRERVYTSDIKKLFTWYNILSGAGITNFEEEATADN